MFIFIVFPLFTPSKAPERSETCRQQFKGRIDESSSNNKSSSIMGTSWDRVCLQESVRYVLLVAMICAIILYTMVPSIWLRSLHRAVEVIFFIPLLWARVERPTGSKTGDWLRFKAEYVAAMAPFTKCGASCRFSWYWGNWSLSTIQGCLRTWAAVSLWCGSTGCVTYYMCEKPTV